MHRSSDRRPGFRPSLEPLEHREVPAVDFSLSGGVLSIDGGIGYDQIAINDYGNGTIKVYNAGHLHTFSGVTKVKARMGGGDDVVNHILQATQTSAITYDINLGSGDDTFTSTVENKSIGADLYFQLNGDSGNDEFYADVTGDVLGAGTYSFYARGDVGQDFFQVFATDLDVLSGGRVFIGAFGEWGRDTIDILFEGEVDSGFTVKGDGGEYDDTIDVDVTLDFGSTGAMYGSYVDGGSGGDDMTFFVRKAGVRDSISVNAEIVGGVGIDYGQISATLVQYGNDVENLSIV
jgi:hypothetical protein